MLVLSRNTSEAVTVDGPCQITVLSVDRGKVRLGFVAPDGTTILRTELLEPDQRDWFTPGDNTKPAPITQEATDGRQS